MELEDSIKNEKEQKKNSGKPKKRKILSLKDKSSLREELLSGIPVAIRKEMIIKEVYDDSITAASCMTVDQKHILMIYNLSVLEEIKSEYGITLRDVGVHEIYHALFFHLTKKKPKNETKENWYKYHKTACELEVNSFISGLQRKPSVYPQDFKMPVGETFNWYYNELKKGKHDDKMPGTKIIYCSLKNKKDLKKIKAELEKLAKDSKVKIELNKDWSKKSANNVPTKSGHTFTNIRCLRVEIEKNMRKFLHEKFKKTKTYRRPHKFKELSPGNGRIVGPKIAYLIDCSGSTLGEEQTKYYNAVRRLSKAYRGHIIEFDDEIKYVGKTPTFKQWGGGTNFIPPLEQCRKLRVDLAVWLTDCHGPWSSDKEMSKIHHIIVSTGGESPFEGNGKIKTIHFNNKGRLKI